jgi:hypothetical protein
VSRSVDGGAFISLCKGAYSGRGCADSGRGLWGRGVCGCPSPGRHQLAAVYSALSERLDGPLPRPLATTGSQGWG